MSRESEAKTYYQICMEAMTQKPVPKRQKFAPGTRVRIADDLGPSMWHFTSGTTATVLYTYAHAYGGGDVYSYCLDIYGVGKVSWYYENQLSALEGEASIENKIGQGASHARD